MRIIAGQHGGRRLVAPAGDATRPTPDRVREALFSILGTLDGVRIADLYAGTGAVGLEAISRGARDVIFVENGARALEALRRNIASLGVAAQTVVIARAVGAAVLVPHAPFDVVFADPPYAFVRTGAAGTALGAIVASGSLAPGGTLVLEHDGADPPPNIAGASAVSTRRYGDTALSFYEAEARTSLASPGDV
jgi:16S rRNA (guanine966-N2)-methyltransferase